MKGIGRGILIFLVIFAFQSSLRFPESTYAESFVAVRQEITKDWKEIRKLQRRIVVLKRDLQKKREQLLVLAKQNKTRVNLDRYYSLIKRAQEFSHADSRLWEELKVVLKTRNAQRKKEIITALLTHKNHEFELLKEAEKILDAEIERLKR
jgi:hypothetical protein